jgi:hypothetical protein
LQSWEYTKCVLTFDGEGVGSGFLLVVVTLVVVVTLLDVGFGGSDVGRLMLSLQRPPIHVIMYVWRGSS